MPRLLTGLCDISDKNCQTIHDRGSKIEGLPSDFVEVFWPEYMGKVRIDANVLDRLGEILKDVGHLSRCIGNGFDLLNH
jgi:hypothetical protein